MSLPLQLNPWRSIEAIRHASPVVHSITNYVVMNTTANALLAIGASPVMAHAEEEMADMVAIASALVLNIGTLSRSWVSAMHVAAEAAKQRRIPIVLDPVGVGATRYRTQTARELVRVVQPTIIRGNASEVMALSSTAEMAGSTKGVDSRDPASAAVDAARRLHDVCGATICVSGETDYVIGGGRVIRVRNGHPMMPRVTGLGCTASALCGAFASVHQDATLATVHTMVTMGVAGELAAARASGPGTLQLHFLDALYGLSEQDLVTRMRAEYSDGAA